jgi:hypothetical protein
MNKKTNTHKYHRYTGVLIFVHSHLVNKAGEVVTPSFEAKMLDQFKPENEQEYTFIQSTEILGRVYANTQVDMVDNAHSYAKEKGLHDYNIICIKNPRP